MKTLTLAIGFILFFAAAFAENSTEKETSAKSAIIKGKVVDAATGEALTGVEIIFPGTEKSVYTDFDGEFEVEDVPFGEYAIQINYISYRKKIIRCLSKSDNSDLTIKLVSSQPLAHSKTIDELPTA